MHASKTRPDVALVMNVANGFWLPLLKQCRIPTLVNVDGIEWERAKWGRAARSAFMAGAALTAKHADRLVYDSAEIGRRWQERYGREGVFIPYGASEPLMTTFDDELVRRQYALMVARFVPENTVTEFFNAATRLSLRWNIAIVGSSGYGGPIDAQAKELADSNDRIKWFGHLNDDPKLFGLWQNAGAYFHGHSVGGTNPALVQAMACGAPTVARDTVYNREVLGDAGLFVEPRGGAIATAMDEVLCDTALQSRLSAAVRVRQQHAYTWDLVCDKYSATLESMIHRKLARTA
jgi:glycosyltransferase involved in cell wall biosynthesis